MKSRNLDTKQVVVVTNYTIKPAGTSGKWLHAFTPLSTPTVYQFEANSEPLLTEGDRYSIGFEVKGGVRWVDRSAIARADDVDKTKSHAHARALGEELREEETRKSRTRVVVQSPRPGATYLGTKYAWRIFGMAVARDTFEDYLRAVAHPAAACETDGNPSHAYEVNNLSIRMDELIQSAVRVSGNRFRSNLLPDREWFVIKGLKAITDKK